VVQNLHKWYGTVHALDGVNLEVRKGEVVAFLGPNGAGKTTFTKCILGFLRPSAGSVRLFGSSIEEARIRILPRVGLVPDQYDFYGGLNSVQHLRFYGRLQRIPARELGARIQETLTLVGMTEHARRKVREYSHGMKQRLCIAQALLNKPEFVIFDEPTNGLDPRGASEVRQLIQTLSKQGVTIFLSSHILSEVEQVCTRVAILSKGRVVVQSTVPELRQRLRGAKTRVTITLQNPLPELERVAITQAGATSARLEGEKLVCELEASTEIPGLVEALSRAGGRIVGVQEESVGLEQMFLELTRGEGGF
jgi:lantibiotic transport system ATP-binding protein